MEILSLQFETRQFLYQLSRSFTTCVSETTGPWKMRSPTIEILWYRMAMLRIHSSQISLKAIWIVATYRYRHRIQQFKEEGHDFSCYMYVPELDPTTGAVFHEREDHCHILKRIWKHTREGGPDFLDVNSFDAAMMDPNTGLTHAALVGERKQSVPDAEKMFSYLAAKFLREHGYETEAYYVETVAGWHEAADGRGLTELERCRKNYSMLNMILDEWMPWHRDNYDFTTIDINRYHTCSECTCF